MGGSCSKIKIRSTYVSMSMPDVTDGSQQSAVSKHLTNTQVDIYENTPQ
jgi:hypothetical protein